MPFFLLFILPIMVLFYAPLLHAQMQTTATLVADPAYPEANTSVTLTLSAYSQNLNGASIIWYVDGVEHSNARDTREITLQAGDYGELTTVVARVRLADNMVFDAQHTIKPTRVDIVIEADTHTPLFYKGRALPSLGSTIRATAIPVTADKPSDLTYTWKVDGKSLYGGPLRGKENAEFSLTYGKTAFVSVEVSDAGGDVFARKIIEIAIVEPETHFYELNPLRGLSRTTLFDPHQLIGSELNVRAEPYYIASDIFDVDHLIEWKVNGRSLANPSVDPQNITLRGDGGSGTFRIEFHIRNLETLTQGTRDEFRVVF